MFPDKPERKNVKYPFETAAGWPLRHHIPYTVKHEGRSHRIVVSIFAQPSVHGQIVVSCEGGLVAKYDELVPGSIVEITGDAWRVAAVEYRTHIMLERVQNSERTDGEEEKTGAQAAE
jgi:hypothetical protein